MTIKKRDLNSAFIFMGKKASTMSICPVLLTGSHSLIPSTIPITRALNISKKERVCIREV